MELIILIILSVVQIIVLICFFFLCMHVSAIKKTVVAVNPWQASFNLYYSTGQVDKATQLLMQSIMQESDFADAFYLNTSIRESAQKRLSDKYAPYLDLLGMKFDFDKANSFIAKF